MNEEILLKWAIQCMNTAAFIYLAACFFYVFAVATARPQRTEMWLKWGGWAQSFAFLLHTSALLMRWYIGGISRPPWTNLYESLVFFAWGVSLFQLYARRAWKLRFSGLISLPLIFVLMGMSVMTPNKGVEPLIPALQSYWLKIHVVFGMLSYAGFTMAGCLAFLHLVKSGVSMSRMMAGMSLLALLNLFIIGGQSVWTEGRFEMARTIQVEAADGKLTPVKETYREYEGGPLLTRKETVPGAQIPFYLAVAAFMACGFFSLRKIPGGPSRGGLDLSRSSWSSYGVALVGMFGVLAAIFYGVNQSESLTLHSNPYLVVLLAMTFFFALAFAFMARSYSAFLQKLPSAERLDELSYVNILFAFPFQTLLLVTGAIWAFYAWGRSWGWDPKETWALITWLAFLIYLHGRLLMRWKPLVLSLVAIGGFMILVFAFLGVNLVLSGLHAYGSA